jgi:hypothetical protein
VTVFDQVAMPPQHGVRADQQPQPAQRRAGHRDQQCRQERSVLGSKSRALTTKLALQDAQLVAQGEDLDVLLAVGHRQQSPRSESIADSEVGEAEQHGP